MAERASVDIEGLQDKIAEAHSDNPLWSRMSLSQKLRVLIEDGIEAAQKSKQSKKNK